MEFETKYHVAMGLLIRLQEIVDGSETDSHWTTRVEWLVDEASVMIDEYLEHN